VTLQYLEVWPPSKGLSLPLELPQCLSFKIHMVLLCNVILFHFRLRFLDFLGVMRINFFFVVFLLGFSVCFVFAMN
jgi:hypothetical protein